jgi:hypothetical protein
MSFVSRLYSTQALVPLTINARTVAREIRIGSHLDSAKSESKEANVRGLSIRTVSIRLQAKNRNDRSRICGSNRLKQPPKAADKKRAKRNV